jgi:hypothetical protein
MTPPAGPGQHNVLKTHYERIGSGPVAYLDETYHLENDGRRRFYVMAAVVVLEPDRDPLRNELDSLVPSGWWHTTNELRTDGGRNRARALLETFQVPDEICVIVDKVSVDEDDDKEGTRARGAALGRLLTALHTAEHGTHPPVGLTVLEESVSPGSEHLLWLPGLQRLPPEDGVSADRLVRGDRRPDARREAAPETANPRLP